LAHICPAAPELNVATWTALLAPAGTPPEMTKVLERELNKALQDRELRQTFEQSYYETIPASPAQATQRIETEIARNGGPWCRPRE